MCRMEAATTCSADLFLSLVWFSVQSWTGGLCIQNILSAIFPSYQHMENHFPASANLDTKQFIGWIIFNVLMALIIYIKPERIQWVSFPQLNTLPFIKLIR